MSLSIRGLKKQYNGVQVLDNVSLTVQDGEIHALLGGNGAGKSTLIKCVSGAAIADAGDILLNNRIHRSLTPREALQNGVAVVYQDLSVVDSLSVVDNIFLGDERRVGPFVLTRRELYECRQWLGRFGGDLEPHEIVGSLGSAERQIVEIIKALRREPAVLILDEPTAALTEAEQKILAAAINAARNDGNAILFVTHRLAEVFELADRVTVLRGGNVVLSAAVGDVSHEELVRAITGRELRRIANDSFSENGETPIVLTVRGLIAPGIGPIDLTVRRGQVLGVFGLVGSGRTELLEAIFGARNRRFGNIEVSGLTVRGNGPPDAIAAGIALVPSDRLRSGLIASMRADENVLLPRFTSLAFLNVWRNRSAESRAVASTFEALRVAPPIPELEARRFSGGNQQKLVVGRWLSEDTKCRVILLDEPTNGVDVGGRSELYSTIRAFAESGGSVVVTSSEPSELLQIASQIIVLGRGRVVAMLNRAEANEDMLISAAHSNDGMEIAS
jgi:ribose transport system ATP-binding protein